MKILAVVAVGLIIAGCTPANIIATKWDSGAAGKNASTRCKNVDMIDNSEMKSIFAKYDGWKMVYMSEYTTGILSGTSAAVCFEKEN